MMASLKSREKQWLLFKLLIVVMDMLWRAILGSKQNTNNEDKLCLKMIAGKVAGRVSVLWWEYTLHQTLNKGWWFYLKSSVFNTINNYGVCVWIKWCFKLEGHMQNSAALAQQFQMNNLSGWTSMWCVCNLLSNFRKFIPMWVKIILKRSLCAFQHFPCYCSFSPLF